MMKKNLITMLSLGSMVLAAAPALAQPSQGPGPRFRKSEARLERMKQKLGLSEDQVARIKSLRASHRAEMASTRGELAALREQLHQVLGAPVLNESKALALHQKLQAYKKLKREARFKHRLQVLGVLSAEQRAQLMQMRSPGRFGKGRVGRGRFGRGCFGGGGPAGPGATK
jgi:Spy/CpxP family protein refolding chaperone